MTAIKRALFWAASNPEDISTYSLWATDGTLDGTVIIADIAPTPFDEEGRVDTRLGDLLIFSGYDKAFDTVFYVSDGTATGTRELRLNTGETVFVSASFSGGTVRAEIVVAGNQAFFIGSEQGEGQGLYVTDGTDMGTFRVNLPDEPGLRPSDMRNLFAIGDKVVFGTAVNDDVMTVENELYVSDGTEVGTFQLAEINPGDDGASRPTNFTALGNGRAIFGAQINNNSEDQFAVWVTDGTIGGTFQLAVLDSNALGFDATYNFFAFNGLVYFSALDGSTEKLWVTDGTVAGTQVAFELIPNGVDSAIEFHTVHNGQLYFTANSGTSDGFQLYRTDGTLAGTEVVRGDQPSSLRPKQADDFATIGDSLYFSAIINTGGREVWVIDGNDDITIISVNVGSGDSNPENFFEFDGQVLFSAFSEDDGEELFFTDGTFSGTNAFTDLSFPFGLSAIDLFAVIDVETVFTGTNLADELSGNEFDNELRGLDGDDTLVGESGADLLIGGDGDDLLIGDGVA